METSAGILHGKGGRAFDDDRGNVQTQRPSPPQSELGLGLGAKEARAGVTSVRRGVPSEVGIHFGEPAHQALSTGA